MMTLPHIVGLLLGCQGLNEEQAELVFFAIYKPLHESRDHLLAGTQDTISTTLQSGNGWEGTVKVDGSVELTDISKDYNLELTLTELYVQEQDITIDGSFPMQILYTRDQTDAADNTNYEVVTSVTGEVSITGDVQGSAVLDFQFSESFDKDTNIKTPSSSGTISDMNISGLL